jgi:hypothetical protein
MKRKTLLLSAVVYILLLCQIANAQSYYVDITKPTNGTGTITSPWNSVLNAMYNIPQPNTADVTLYFRQGTYYLSADTTIYIGSNKSGLNGHHFILSAYPGEKVTIDGSKLVTNYSYMVSIADANNIRFKGLTFANLENIVGYGFYIQGTTDSVDFDSCTFRNFLWNSDTSEAKFPNPGINLYPFYITGSGSLPGNISVDTCLFATIATGDTAKLFNYAGTTSRVSQLDNTDSNLIAEGPRNEFYVSPTGSDTTGTGSKTKPWRTPRFALNGAGYSFATTPATLLDSNITIYLRDGTYYLDTSLYIGHNRGQNGKWTTLINYPGEYPTLDGGNLTQKFSCIIIIDSASYVEINGLNLQNLTDDSTLTTISGGVVSKDTRYGIEIAGPCAHISIDSNDLYNMKWTRDTTKAKNPQPNDVLSAITVLGNSNTPITDLIIDNNTIHNIVPGYAEGMTMNGNVDSFTIIGNEVYDVANIGICAAGNYQWVLAQYPSLLKSNNQSRNGLIQDNSVYRCVSPVATSAGIYLDGSLNVTVTGNESYNNGTGLSVGNEQDSSTSGGHTIISNDFWSNLGPGMYLGSNNPTSTCSTVVVKYNTITDDWTINPTLYARANGKYGTLDSSGQGPELYMQRIQNLTVDENDVYSSSDNLLTFAFSQSSLKFTYNDYYTKDDNPCKAYFYRDTVGNGDSSSFKKDTTFNQYAFETTLDTTSYLGGTAYNRHGCGITPAAFVPDLSTGQSGIPGLDSNSLTVFPDPVLNRLSVYITQQTAGPVRLELWDMSGRLLLWQEGNLSPGTNELGWENIKQGGIVPGVYILHIVTRNQHSTRKIVVL